MNDLLQEKARRIVDAYEAMEAMFPFLAANGDLLAHSVEVCRAYLAEHLADDETPVDEAWLLAAGFEQDDRGQVSLGVVTVLKWNNTTLWCFYFDGCCGPELLTRGSVRRLCKALGVELKENSK